jgi:hypothetical protein
MGHRPPFYVCKQQRFHENKNKRKRKRFGIGKEVKTGWGFGNPR